MGNIASYCCKDDPQLHVEVNDEREEQSRIWSENGSNQQYGACLPPKSPTIYKIVLPRLERTHIEEYNPIAGVRHPIPNLITSSHEQSNGDDESSKRLTLVIKEEYCPNQFEHLRSLVLKNPNEQTKFKELLQSCVPWSAPGGKSGSTFLKTVNNQFILKEMSKVELQSFLSIANEYFRYVEDAYNDNKSSLLSTIFGIYRIVYTTNANHSGQEYYFMVMKNLFHDRTISQRFDLKGSVRNRLTNTSNTDNTEHVLMDENLLLIACDHPLFIEPESKRILNECIDNDSRFLASIAVMDYSLLVGVDKENNELVLGIIDYVRPFTWDKKIERVIKSVISSELPTIVEPQLYRERFREAMDQYFESVPPIVH